MNTKNFSFSRFGKIFSIGAIAIFSVSIIAMGGFFVSQAQATSSIGMLISPNGGEQLSGIQTITWKTTNCASGDTVNLVLGYNGSVVATPGSTKTIVSGLSCSSGSYTLWNTNDSSIGDRSDFVIQIERKDSSGEQEASDSSDGFFTIDNTAPTFTVTSSSLGTPSNPVQTTGNINVIVDASVSGLASTAYGFSNTTGSCSSADYGGGGTFTSGTDFTIAGDHTGYLCVKATDNAGNIGYKQVGQINTDNTAPTVTDGNISLEGGTLLGDGTRVYKNGDTAIIVWNNSSSGDDNIDIAGAIASVTGTVTGTGTGISALQNALPFAQMPMTNTGACGGKANHNIYEACYTLGSAGMIPAGLDITGVFAKVTATDNAGNVGSGTDSTVSVLDTTPPAAPIITQIGNADNYINIANENTVHVTGTAEAGSTVSVTLTDSASTPVTTTAVTGTADSSGNYDITVNASSLSDGTVTATVNATDPAGNIGPDKTGSATKDTVAPTMSTITTKDTNNNGKIDEAVVVFDEPVLDSTFSAGDFTIGGVTATSIDYGTANDDTITVKVSGGVTGTDAKTVTYTQGIATDLAGNPLATFTDTSTTDGAGPVLLSAVTTSQTTIDATFSEKIDSATLNTTGSEFTLSGGYNVTGATENSDGVITLTVDTMPTGATPDVTFTQNGSFTDETGNEAVSPVTVTATDGVAPILSDVSIASNNASTTLAKAGNKITLKFTSSETINYHTVKVMIDGKQAGVNALTKINPNDWTATYTMTNGDTEGLIHFTIDYTDTAGNVGTQVTATDDSSSVFYDRTAPTVDAGSNKEVNATVTQNATVTENGSGVATYAWTQESGPTGGAVTFGTPNAEDTTISASADGVYTLKLTATDNAGNSASDTMQLTWDTTNPVEIASTPSNGANNVSTTIGDIKVIFNEPVTSLDTSKVMLTDVSTGLTVISGTVAISGNTISIPHNAFTDGTQYRINVLPGAVKDIAGNNLTVNFIHLFTTSATPDTTAPAVPVISTSDATVDANYYTITGTDESDGGQRIVNLYNGSALAGTAVLASGVTNWTINASLTQDADNVFKATATDDSGNESDASNPVTITEAAPEVVVPTISLVGDTITTSYTATDAGTRFGSGLQFDTTDTASYTVTTNGVTASPVTVTGTSPVTITAVPKADAITLGLHLYTVVVTSSTGNTVTKTVAYQVNANPTVQPPVISNIQAVNIGTSTATVSWTTNESATSKVNYGPTSSYGTTVASSSSAMHAVVLTGLTPNTTYYFRVVSADTAGNTATSTDNTFITAVDNSTAVLSVTGIGAIANANGSTGYATAGGDFANGWAWTFHVTVPTTETHLQMQFSDFVGAGGSTIPVASNGVSNLRFYSAQSSNANASNAITIGGSDTYSAPMTLTGDIAPNTAGRQVDITVEMRIPSGTAGGSYSTSYGINTATTTSAL